MTSAASSEARMIDTQYVLFILVPSMQISHANYRAEPHIDRPCDMGELRFFGGGGFGQGAVFARASDMVIFVVGRHRSPLLDIPRSDFTHFVLQAQWWQFGH